MTRGGLANTEINRLVNPPVDTFTMSGYVSFITEFGLLVMVLLVFLVIGGGGSCESQLEPTHVLLADSDGVSVCAVRRVCVLCVAFVGVCFDGSEDVAFHRA
jgi:hypothetical protein